MARIPNVKVVMTPFPHTISDTASLAEALGRLNEWQIGQLPVLHDGAVAGLVTRRAIEVAQALGVDLGAVQVLTVSESNPVVVDLNERLDHVLLQLAEQRSRCALVTREGRPAGILTATDVATLLADRVRADAGAPEPGDGVA